jgi:DNA modification methylase
LQDDGWWLCRDNVWHKPNPMPESTKDRCTSSHEYLFHLTNALGAGKIAVAIFYGLQLEICTP